MAIKRCASFIIVLLATGLFDIQASSAADYFIDSLQGNDAASGLGASAPWKSLAKINKTGFKPGDRILFRRGRTWHGSLVMTSSGTREAPVFIQGYGPETDPAPVISGIFPGTVKWEHVRDDIYKARSPGGTLTPGVVIYKGSAVPPVTTLKFVQIDSPPQPGAVLLQLEGIYRTLWVTSVHKNTVSGYSLAHFDIGTRVHVRQMDNEGRETQWEKTLPPPEIVTDINSLCRPGHWYVDTAQKAIYVYSDKAPARSMVQIGHEKWGIRLVNCSHVTVKDIAVDGFGEVGVWIHNGNSITLDNLKVSNTGCAGHRTGILLFNSSNCTVSHCAASSSLGNGIVLYAYTGGDHATRGSCNNMITHNSVTDSGAAGISLSTDSPDTASLVRDNIIAENIIEHSNSMAYDAAGIYLLNSGEGNILRGNLVRNGGNSQLRSSGIMLDGGACSTVIEHNTIESNSLAGIAATGSSHRIEGNTLKDNGNMAWDSAQIVLFPVTANASSCVIKHNTMKAGAGRKLVMRTLMPGRPELTHHIDHNNYITAEPRPFCWSTSWSCRRWLDFQTWKKLTGQDAHSAFRFAN